MSDMQKTMAFLDRGSAYVVVSAVSGYTAASSGEPGPECGYKKLDPSTSWQDVMTLAEFVGFTFEPDRKDKRGFPRIYNACHAEAQLIAFFAKKHFLFRSYDGNIPAQDGLLQLFLLQPRILDVGLGSHNAVDLGPIGSGRAGRTRGLMRSSAWAVSL
ncbi:hypothetical protein LX36DRAFT_49813 [Colletotrichum falcatum]|nr:hypothetical protein LX36DRAFT_49813 [Colletotrichum falcatum]